MKSMAERLWCMVGLIMLTTVAFPSEVTPEYLKAQAKGASTNVRIRIVDDADNSIADASVNVLMGMLDPTQSHWIRGVTDTNGVFVLEGKTCGNEIIITISKEGYYDSNRTLCYVDMRARHAVKNGKWQPWGSEERIVLRKIRNPIELKRQSVREYRDVDIINEWVGFDLERNDFVADNHMGKCSDFEVRFVWDGKWLPDYTGMTVEIRFPQKGSGGYWVEDCLESGFKWVYDAEINATYAKDFSFFEKMPKGCARTYKHFDANKSLVVRSRCVFDEKGNLEAANYACVDMLGFSCAEKGIASLYVISVFNPTPNDTNLEPKW